MRERYSVSANGLTRTDEFRVCYGMRRAAIAVAFRVPKLRRDAVSNCGSFYVAWKTLCTVGRLEARTNQIQSATNRGSYEACHVRTQFDQRPGFRAFCNAAERRRTDVTVPLESRTTSSAANVTLCAPASFPATCASKVFTAELAIC
jgi:hypothetical protein